MLTAYYLGACGSIGATVNNIIVGHHTAAPTKKKKKKKIENFSFWKSSSVLFRIIQSTLQGNDKITYENTKLVADTYELLRLLNEDSNW